MAAKPNSRIAQSSDIGLPDTGAGKGDRPRNLSEAFRQNYDLIDWGRKMKNERKVGKNVHPA